MPGRALTRPRPGTGALALGIRMVSPARLSLHRARSSRLTPRTRSFQSDARRRSGVSCARCRLANDGVFGWVPLTRHRTKPALTRGLRRLSAYRVAHPARAFTGSASPHRRDGVRLTNGSARPLAPGTSSPSESDLDAPAARSREAHEAAADGGPGTADHRRPRAPNRLRFSHKRRCCEAGPVRGARPPDGPWPIRRLPPGIASDWRASSSTANSARLIWTIARRPKLENTQQPLRRREALGAAEVTLAPRPGWHGGRKS